MTEQSDLTADPFAPAADEFARTGDLDTEMAALLRHGLFPEELAVILAPLPELAGVAEEHPERAMALARELVKELDDDQLLDLFDAAPWELREELNEALADNFQITEEALRERAERSGAEAARLREEAKRV